MNIQEYIATGVLESYVLGELTAQERAEVEKLLTQYPELKDELGRIEEAQESFLRKAAISPRPAVKDALVKKLGVTSGRRETPRIEWHQPQSSFWRYAASAAIVLALTTSYMAYHYYGRWRASENNLSELIAQNQRLAQEYNTVNQRLDRIETDLRITSNPAYRRVVMTGTAHAPGAMASVYWNPDTKEAYLSIQNLQALAQENQYQLWAIIDGKPVDAGVFDAGVAGLLRMKTLAGATAFAVTIEPRGGRPLPTLETMQVFGEVKG